MWAFDCEWVPDPLAGRLVYHLPDDMPDLEVIQHMWQEGGATEEDPMPFLKTVLCRVVSIAFVTRYVNDGQVQLNLHSLPGDLQNPDETDEAKLIHKFLHALGMRQPQLVGFNSINADLRILVQRGMALGVQAGHFCQRPNKPWEGVDYFSEFGDWHIDLMKIYNGFGKSYATLHELASIAGIPGKMEMAGSHVAKVWLEGRWQEIIHYNEFDAITTYLLWLKTAHFAGKLTTQQWKDENQLLHDLLSQQAEEGQRVHLFDFLVEWERMISLIEATGRSLVLG